MKFAVEATLEDVVSCEWHSCCDECRSKRCAMRCLERAADEEMLSRLRLTAGTARRGSELASVEIGIEEAVPDPHANEGSQDAACDCLELLALFERHCRLERVKWAVLVVGVPPLLPFVAMAVVRTVALERVVAESISSKEETLVRGTE